MLCQERLQETLNFINITIRYDSLRLRYDLYLKIFYTNSTLFSQIFWEEVGNLYQEIHLETNKLYQYNSNLFNCFKNTFLN